MNWQHGSDKVLSINANVQGPDLICEETHAEIVKI